MEFFWRLMGRMTQVFAVSLSLPFLAACLFRELPSAGALLATLIISALVAYEFMLRSRRSDRRGQMSIREGAFFMTAIWLVLGALGMLPYLLAGLTADPAAAFFTSVSALTTTGISGLGLPRADWPQALLLWHGVMSWLGGLGVVIILVSVLPQVSGCFGLTLSARQMVFFSPVWGKMREFLEQGVRIYAAMTAAILAAFLLAGLTPWRALFMAFITISSGGDIDTFALALGCDYWPAMPALTGAEGAALAAEAARLLADSLPEPPLALVLASFWAMLFGSVNFLLFCKAWERRSPRLLLMDTELRVFLLIVLLGTVLLAVPLCTAGERGLYGAGGGLGAALFQSMSFLSTSGLITAPVWLWTDFERFVLFLLVFVGGCIGSATGGLKVMRLIVLARLADVGLETAQHPRAVTVVKVDGLPIEEKITGRILAFFFIYIAVFILAVLVLSLALPTLTDALRLSAACLTSTGAAAALGLIPAAELPGWAKLFCTLLMTAGRVEIFSLLVVIGIVIRTAREHW